MLVIHFFGHYGENLVVDQDSGERHRGRVFGRWTLYRVVRVRGLAEDIIQFSWARHFTRTVRLSNQLYTEWISTKLKLEGVGKDNPMMD